MELRSDSQRDVTHSPPIIGAVPLAGKALPVINCAHFRHDGSSMSCAAGLTAGIAQCSACSRRAALVAIPMRHDAIHPVPSRMRGLGDLVERCIRALFLGRLDVAQSLAARVERLWSGTPRQAQAVPQVKANGCGCKARKDALNRAIPFNRHAH